MTIESLSAGEELVMRAIWDLNSTPTLSEITDIVNNRYNKPWASQTVSTYLFKLRIKNYIEMQRGFRKCKYLIKVSEKEYRINLLTRILDFHYKKEKDVLLEDIKRLE